MQAPELLKQMGISYTPQLAREMEPTYARLQHVIPELEWQIFAPYIKAIEELKREKRAVILAHNYQTPEIFHTIADSIGDSLQLAREAASVEADMIVQCGVHFMAETSKLLNPDKKVLIPDREAGCSLAESITGADVRTLREAHPNIPIISYVNTSAEVKAESDICCTSSNAVAIVESFGVDKVLCIPDEYLAKNIAAQTKVEVLAWKGKCEVHERFTAKELRDYRAQDERIQIIAHPECMPEVLKEADFSGSTSAMIKWVHENRPEKVLLVTECSMSDNVAIELPETEFVRPCNLCPHMKKITLPKILESLVHEQYEIEIEPHLIAPARQAVERMIALNK